MTTDETWELHEKLSFLIKDKKPRSIAKHVTGKEIKSRPDLVQVIGLKSHANLYPESGRLSDRVESRIREIYNITLESKCWAKFAAGSAADFIEEYHKLHPDLPLVNSSPTPEPERALEVDRDKQKRRETHPLASLVLFTLQPGPGEPWPISFELCCNPDEDDLDNVAVKRGRLIIDVGAAEIDSQSRPGFVEPAKYKASQGEVSFSWNGPMRNVGYVWRVAAEGDYIGNVRVPLEEGFCKIRDLQPGGAVKARFEIVLKDLTHRPDEEPRPGTRQLPIVRLGVEGLGEAKEWIVRRIKELALSDNDGRVLLAEHIVPFRALHLPGQKGS